MFLFGIANFKNNQILIFLSFCVPMSKFGAKVELRCNDGSYQIEIIHSWFPENKLNIHLRFISLQVNN